MSDGLEQLRARIERFYASAGRAQLERWRGAAPEAVIRHSPLSRALVSDESTDALHAAGTSGRIDATQYGWLGAHLERIRLSLALAQRRGRLARRLHEALSAEPGGGDVVGRVKALVAAERGNDRNELAQELETLAGSIAADWLELLAVLREKQDAPTPAEVVPRIDAFMRGTDALAGELVARARLSSARGSRPWAELLHAARARPLDGLTAAVDRHRRLAAAFEGLGFGADMGRHLSVEAPIPAVLASPELAVLEVPGDVRIGPPQVEYGLWADQSMARALGRAVALALVSRGLPVEQRWPLPQAPGPLLGALFAQWLADPMFVRRGLGYSARDAERVAQHHAWVLVLATRVRCAVALAGPGRDGRDTLERLEHGAERALGVPVPGALVALLGVRPEAWREADVAVQGLALAVGMRERFDEDWFRSPAAGQALRGVCAQGNGGSSEPVAALSGELSPSAASARAHELAVR